MPTPEYLDRFGKLTLGKDGFLVNPYQGELGLKLAQGVIDHVRSVPEAWDQGIFVDGYARRILGSELKPICGSAACLAGWTGSLHAGVLPRFMTDRGACAGHSPIQASNYAAFLLGVDPEEFNEQVYTVTSDPELAIKNFCRLTGAQDPGWSDQAVALRAMAQKLGFLPGLIGAPLARQAIATLRRNPAIFGAYSGYPGSLLGSISGSYDVDRVVDHLLTTEAKAVWTLLELEEDSRWDLTDPGELNDFIESLQDYLARKETVDA